MKYFTIKIETAEDGTTKKSILEHEAIGEAVKEYHSNMSAGIQQEGLKSVMSMVINSDGGVYNQYNSVWYKDEPKTEAITEPMPEATAETTAE